MASIEVTPARLKDLPSHVPDGEPVVMLNLLRYRDSVGTGKNDLTGRQSYERYLLETEPVLMEVGGRLLFRGQVRFLLIGPEEERWDEVILIRFPTLGAFERMVSDPRHEAGVVFRTAALEDSRMIATVMPTRMSWTSWWWFRIRSKFSRSKAGHGTPARVSR